jgi:uncharacterized protein
MPHSADQHTIRTVEQLEALLGVLSPASLKKEIAFVHPHYRALIEASPFALLATTGPGGLDASPRGDAPGFIVVENETTLLLPERRGNNRADSLRNIVADPKVALLFLIPGLGETLRVNGRASITTEPAVLARFEVQGACPKMCHPHRGRDRVLSEWLPTPGKILAALTEGAFDGATYDRELPARQSATLY